MDCRIQLIPCLHNYRGKGEWPRARCGETMTSSGRWSPQACQEPRNRSASPGAPDRLPAPLSAHTVTTTCGTCTPSSACTAATEGEFGLGLGPVSGDHLGRWPVVVAGDQRVLGEQFLFQRGRGPAPRRARKGAGPWAGRRSGPSGSPAAPMVWRWSARSRRRNFSRRRRVLPRAKVAVSSPGLLPALATVVPSDPRARAWCRSGE
jgi:hypothetical protein